MKQLSLLILFSIFGLTSPINAQAPLLEKELSLSSSDGEISLEDYFMKTIKIAYTVGGENNINDVPVSENTGRRKKRSVTDEEARIEIYNEDLTHEKTLKLSNLDSKAWAFSTLESSKQGDKRFYITQTLFNDDDLYEFVLIGENYFSIVNENGDVLYKEIVAENWNIYNGLDIWLFETSSADNTYLVVEYPDQQWTYYRTIYRINKGGGTGINSASVLGKVKSYPNPATDYVNVTYDLGAVTSGLITFVDLQGKEVIRKEVVNEGNTCVISTKSLNSGVYIVNVNANGKLISSERIIVK